MNNKKKITKGYFKSVGEFIDWFYYEQEPYDTFKNNCGEVVKAEGLSKLIKLDIVNPLFNVVSLFSDRLILLHNQPVDDGGCQSDDSGDMRIIDITDGIEQELKSLGQLYNYNKCLHTHDYNKAGNIISYMLWGYSETFIFRSPVSIECL